jgi:hypothetical protein
VGSECQIHSTGDASRQHTDDRARQAGRDSVAGSFDFNPSELISSRLSGAIVLSSPTMMPSDVDRLE